MEDAERVIKDVIQQDDLLPLQHKHLQPDEWDIDLADYFECVSGGTAARSWLLRRTLESVTEQVSECADVGLQLQLGRRISCETRNCLPISCNKKQKRNSQAYAIRKTLYVFTVGS